MSYKGFKLCCLGKSVKSRLNHAEVSYHTCYDKKSELIEQVKQFQDRIKHNPIALADRLWVKTLVVQKTQISLKALEGKHSREFNSCSKSFSFAQ